MWSVHKLTSIYSSVVWIQSPFGTEALFKSMGLCGWPPFIKWIPDISLGRNICEVLKRLQHHLIHVLSLHILLRSRSSAERCSHRDIPWYCHFPCLRDLCGEIVKPWLCFHEAVTLNLSHDVCFTSAFCSEIFVDHRLSYEVCALSDSLRSEHAALLRETELIWRNPR